MGIQCTRQHGTIQLFSRLLNTTIAVFYIFIQEITLPINIEKYAMDCKGY